MTGEDAWVARASRLLAQYLASQERTFESLQAPRRVALIVWCDAEGRPREVTMELDTQRRVHGVR